jgi:hypothetical protein
MKYPASLLILFCSVAFGSAAEVKNLVLPGQVFGPGWELTQPNLLGSSAAPNYINRTRTNQPVVMVNIIAFASAADARTRMQQKFSTPEAKKLAKQLPGLPEAFEQKDEKYLKRYVLLGQYWLTVEQIGDKDERGPFIQKYTEHLKKFIGR